MGTPTCNLTVDPTESPDVLHAAVRHVCKTVVKCWADVEEKSMEVSKLTGGITNLLLKVSVKGDELPLEAVTCRIFGPDTETVIDRSRERQVIRHLSTAGFGAQLIGLFQNGMVQTFIIGRTLAPSDLYVPKMAARIARELRKLHEIDVPISKKPQLWIDISKFMEKACTLSFEEPEKQKKYEAISFTELWQEIDELKVASKGLNAPTVFAHNDLLAGNLMFNDEIGVLHLIDYEYSTYNYRGYDIANHFNEYAGLECDYSLYPDREAQNGFFRNYLHPDCPQNGMSAYRVLNYLVESLCPIARSVLLSRCFRTSEAELEELFVETSCYALASHMYWAVWAIVQARYSNIEFEYLDYFNLRFEEYKKRKSEFLSLVRLRQP